MKRPFKNTQEVLGACWLVAGQYHDNHNDIKEDKCLKITVVELNNTFKVITEWVYKQLEDDSLMTNDYFEIHKQDGHNQLEKCMIDSLNLVTEREVEGYDSN